MFESPGLRARIAGCENRFATNWMCDLLQVTEPLRAWSVKRE